MSDKINCSQIFGANVRANNLKLPLVEKYLSQEKWTTAFATEFIVKMFSKVCSGKFFRTNHTYGILK